MRYFCYNDYDEYGGSVITLSEEEILLEYFPYWYDRMCKKYGKEHVDENYSKEDCLDDWKIVHWAWESNE